jgi:shikimate kinase
MHLSKPQPLKGNKLVYLKKMLHNISSERNNEFENSPLRVGRKIYLVGYMAVGKTTIGKQLAKALGYTFLDLDQWIEKEEENTVAHIFKEKGEPYFREIEKRVLHLTKDLQKIVIATGGGTPCFFDNMDFILENGYAIWIKDTVENIAERVLIEKEKRPLLAHLSKKKLQNHIKQQLIDREVYYKRASIMLNSNFTILEEFITFVKKL